MYICIFLYTCICVLKFLRVYASVCTHTRKNKDKGMNAWHNLNGRIDHIYTYFQSNDINKKRAKHHKVRQWFQLNRASGRVHVDACVCLHTHARTHARTHAHKLIQNTIEKHTLRCRRQDNSLRGRAS